MLDEGLVRLAVDEHVAIHLRAQGNVSAHCGAVLQIALRLTHLQVLPHDERLHCAHVKALQRVVHAEAVLARILADLVKVPTQPSVSRHKRST